MSNHLLDILSINETQVAVLKTELARLDTFHGLHFYMREAAPDTLVIGSDGWPGEVRIDDEGHVFDVTFSEDGVEVLSVEQRP